MVDSKPFPMEYIECIECGFYSTVETGQMNREDINEARESRDLEPLADDHVIEPIGEGLKMGRRYWEYAAHHLTYQDVLELREKKGLEPWTDIQAREFLSEVGEQIKETVSVAYEEALDMMIDREEEN
jgi:predicted ATPase